MPLYHLVQNGMRWLRDAKCAQISARDCWIGSTLKSCKQNAIIMIIMVMHVWTVARAHTSDHCKHHRGVVRDCNVIILPQIFGLNAWTIVKLFVAVSHTWVSSERSPHILSGHSIPHTHTQHFLTFFTWNITTQKMCTFRFLENHKELPTSNFQRVKLMYTHTHTNTNRKFGKRFGIIWIKRWTRQQIAMIQ